MTGGEPTGTGIPGNGMVERPRTSLVRVDAELLQDQGLHGDAFIGGSDQEGAENRGHC